MKEPEAKELMAQLESVDNRLGWREEKGLLNPEERALLEVVQIARPFLKTLTDIAISLDIIAISLDIIANNMPVIKL